MPFCLVLYRMSIYHAFLSGVTMHVLMQCPSATERNAKVGIALCALSPRYAKYLLPVVKNKNLHIVE